jgi:uncharacterized protein (TIGR03437 family)
LRPAKRGDVIQLYVTGLGLATDDGTAAGAPLPDAELAPASGVPLYRTVAQPTVLFGDQEAAVLFSGLAPNFAGLYQINVTVPDGVGSSDDVRITVRMPGGNEHAALIAVQD